MLVPLRHLIARRRQPATRAAELAVLRRRFREAAKHEQPSARELELAETMRSLRDELGRALSGVRSCAGCTKGCAPPEGSFDGGHCCSGNTEDVFGDAEVATLVAAGMRPRQLRPPAGIHAGCAFRGAHGCSLAAADRPNICVRYTCRALRRELHARGDIQQVQSLVDELERAYASFVASRAARLRERELAAIHPELAIG